MEKQDQVKKDQEVLQEEKEMQESAASTEATDEVESAEEQTEQTDESTNREAEVKLEEMTNRLLRLQADFDNYRRRVRLDQEAWEKYRAQNLITDLLPALDNFQRALSVSVGDNDTAKVIIQGMEMVYRQLMEALKKEGLEEIEAVGQAFDPHMHQAVMQVQDENYESNMVVEELQKGYKLNERVIRPTMVKVNQ